MSKIFVGVDIGGTKCAVTLSGEDALVMDKIRFDTIPFNPGANIKRIIDCAKSLMDICRVEKLSAIGVSCGGPLDSKKGIILSPPNLPGWDEIEIISILENEFSAPAFLQNDANACALAEWKFGAGRGCRNMIFLTFGTGMGAGLILNGALYGGTSDLAGEAGHIRLADDGPVGYGKAGSFEGFCSGGGITQIAYSEVLKRTQAGGTTMLGDMVSARSLTAEDVGKAALSGDEAAIAVLNKCGKWLGRGLSVLIDLLNPECIVIGSIFARCHEFLWPAANEVLSKEALPYAYKCCKVVPAQLGDEIGDIAALSVAMDGFKRQ